MNPKLLLLLLLIASPLHAQQLKKVVKKYKFPTYTETYYVLPANPDVREGEFIRTSNGKPEIKGQYALNKPIGVWEFYDWAGALAQQFDYTTRKVIFDKAGNSLSETHTYQVADEKGNFYETALDAYPIFIGGLASMSRHLARNLKYPAQARDRGLSGCVLLQVEITRDGQIINERILKGIGGGCDEEALRVMQLLPDEWVPGVKGGVAVTTRMTFPINFVLH
jgi:TonB family protein